MECKHRNIRNIKLRDFFQTKNDDYNPDAFEHKFVGRSSWVPSSSSLSKEAITCITGISNSIARLCRDFFLPCGSKERLVKCQLRRGFNLNEGEINALSELKNNSNFIIKPADKGGAVVVMDKINYKAEAYRQLNNMKYYKKIERPLANEIVPIINKNISALLDRSKITVKQANYLRASCPLNPRSFYLLPKIHKPAAKWPHKRMPEGRPIVSDSGSETERVSELIDYFLKPIAIDSDTYLKDSYDFIGKIRGRNVPENAILVTGDVTALYTNMEIDHSIQRVKEEFILHPDPNRDDEIILNLLEISMKNNDFMFNGEQFLQCCGTAMGKRYAPNLANIYLKPFDRLAKTGFHIEPLLFYRYIDDIFFLWLGTVEQLKEYETYLNSLIPGIQVTLNWSKQRVNFLDTTVYKCPDASGNIKLQTKIYFKPTDTHQLLHATSYHPKHTTKGILKSQILRFKRISSHESEFNQACRILFKTLQIRGYKRSLCRRIKTLVWNTDWQPRVKQQPGQIWPIINYYDNTSAKIMRGTFDAIENMEISKKFSIIQAYKIHQNLRKHLIRSAFHD